MGKTIRPERLHERALDDIKLFLTNGLTGEQFCRTVIDQFDQLYEEGSESGRVMTLALHLFVVGQPSAKVPREGIVLHRRP